VATPVGIEILHTQKILKIPTVACQNLHLTWNQYLAADNFAVWVKQFPKFVIIKQMRKVLYVDICEFLGLIAHLIHPFSPGHETSHIPVNQKKALLLLCIFTMHRR